MLPHGGDGVIVKTDVAYRKRLGYLPNGFRRHGREASFLLASFFEQRTDIGIIESCAAPTN